jgi:CheY-like chemotaxis protein
MSNPIVIHNDNIAIDDLQQISFDADENVDKSITDLLSKVNKDNKYDLIIIKDSLSKNYLDFHGLLLAHHMRLSENFKGRFLPIVIVSDLNLFQINKLTPLARILFTKGMYLIENNPSSIKKLLEKKLVSIDEKILRNDFLEKVSIEPPTNYESSHSIANEWSIYKWSQYLNISDKSTTKTLNNIENMLYFKYLKAKYPIAEQQEKKSISKIKKINSDDKILYIDDEWSKGWKSIFENIFKGYENIEFNCLEEVYKDKEKSEIEDMAIERIIKQYEPNLPDIVLLDLRLHDSDFVEREAKKLTGMCILEKIKKINPGVQVVIFTASQKSLILEEAFDKGALGYIKKEHPDSFNLNTYDNIERLQALIKLGLERRFLKEIWRTNVELNNLLNANPFKKYFKHIDAYNETLKILQKEARYVFEVLDSDMKNRYNYAMVSIVTSLDAIRSIFIPDDKKKQGIFYFWDNTDVRNAGSLKGKILSILSQKMYYKDTNINTNLEVLISKRNDYIHSNEDFQEVSSDEITDWFKLLLLIINVISNPNPKPISADTNPNSRFKIVKKKD